MGKDSTCTALFKLWHVIFSELWIVKYRRLMVLTTKLKFLKVQMTEVSITMLLTQLILFYLVLFRHFMSIINFRLSDSTHQH